PALKPFRCPLGISAMGARHVLGIGAVALAGVAPWMSGDARAAMKHLDRARGDADVDLLADQAVRHRIEEALDLDVIVETDAGQAPLGVNIFGSGQATEQRTLDRLEQYAPADAEPAHRALVHLPHRLLDRGVALGEREEGEVTQPAKNVGLGK